MSDCFYNALVEHIRWLGLPVEREVRWTYKTIRRLSGHKPRNNTFAGVVPLISILIANHYELAYQIEQHMGFDFQKQASPREWHWTLSPGVLKRIPITPGPGIYCDYFKRHAFFWSNEGMPEGLLVQSVKYRKKV